jgi:cell division septation protein DedD
MPRPTNGAATGTLVLPPRAQLPTCVHEQRCPLDPGPEPAIRRSCRGHMPPIDFCNRNTREHTSEDPRPPPPNAANLAERMSGNASCENATNQAVTGQGPKTVFSAPITIAVNRGGFTPTCSTWTPPVTDWYRTSTGNSHRPAAARLRPPQNQSATSRVCTQLEGPPYPHHRETRTGSTAPEVPSAREPTPAGMVTAAPHMSPHRSDAFGNRRPVWP